MTRYSSICQLPEAMREHARAQLEGRIITTSASTGRMTFLELPTAKPRKYRNVPVTVDGQRFDSKLEAKYYQNLRVRKFAGEVKWFLRQVRFDLPGGIIYRCDYEEMLSTGEIVFTDCKGALTDVSRIKLKQVEVLYGIKVSLWPERVS